MVPSGSGRLALLLAALLALNALTMFYSVVSFLPPRVVIEGNANWSDYSTGTWPIQRVAAPSFDKCSGTVFMPNPSVGSFMHCCADASRLTLHACLDRTRQWTGVQGCAN